MTTAETEIKLDFVRQIVADDLKSGKHTSIVTRFPPEPNGFLHVGHAKSICLNFGIAEEYGGVYHLRFDDTNPIKEEQKYIDAIKKDIKWLGFDWGEHEYYASDYFEQFYKWAVDLIKKGKAYVCDLTAEETREYRGTLTTKGKNSPYRDRSIEENLDLFTKMRAGEFEDGARTLKAKIDMTSPNINMRDPVMYRIMKATHPRTGADWCIYPMYDWAHGQSDSIEKITHSLCTLEFEDHRPLYEWYQDELDISRTRQIEFSRLRPMYTVVSKRKLLQLVNDEHVAGWDDPRMPTLAGMRRRGYTPASIRNFCKIVGVTKFNSFNDVALLENSLREDLNKTAPRFMGVLDPVKVVIENYPEGQVEELGALNNPGDESAGTRKVPFSKEIFIERSDFMEDPPRKFFRLGPGREVRLRWAYFITCTDVVKDDVGNVTEIHCTYDPATKGGDAPDGRKVKGTIHWVCADRALTAEVRMYDRLFVKEDVNDVEEGKDWLDNLNPDSLNVLTNCMVEPSVKDKGIGENFQFERQGYFCVDPDSTSEQLVFNRSVPLRDSWGKKQKK